MFMPQLKTDSHSDRLYPFRFTASLIKSCLIGIWAFLLYRNEIRISNSYRAASGIIAAVGIGAKSAQDIYKAVAKMNLAKEEYDMAKVAGTKY
jgi:hypothetical protein